MAKHITYCFSYPICLTRHCANRCGYCRFPVSDPGRLPSPRILRRHLREAALLGASQIELIAGDEIATDPDILDQVRYLGFGSYLGYLTRLLQMIEATNRQSHLFSLVNIGPLSLADLQILRPYICAVRLLLESADPLLLYREAHREALLRSPERRLEAILRCGRAGVPLTTGLLVGIGESRTSQRRAIEIIAQAHERYGHVQAVRIQMFHPAAGTPMANHPTPSDQEFLQTIVAARRRLDSAIALQVSADEHPHLIGALLDAGVTDLGDFSVRPSGRAGVPLEAILTIIADEARKRRMQVVRRLPVYAPFCNPRWYPGGFPHRVPRALDFIPRRPLVALDPLRPDKQD